MVLIFATPKNVDRLSLELRLVREPDRADAEQEAWVARLEGRNPATAVNTFAQRERRYRKRVRTNFFDAGRN